VAELDSGPATVTVGTPSGAAEAWNTEFSAGNGYEVLTPAPADEVAIVARGEYDGSRLPIIVHNNTRSAIEDVSVEGTVFDSSGVLFAVGGALGIDPGWIVSGGIGVGYLYFDGIELPAESVVEMTVSYEASQSRGSLSSLEAQVAEWNQVDDRIVGFLANPHSIEVIEPIAIIAVCLTDDGSITSYSSSFAESASIPVGGQIPFQVTLDTNVCTHIIIVADGFNW
jgi:hypothetical protein